MNLGLSVKWGACNIGTNKPEEYGDYFSWGETETKEEYTEDNCCTYEKSMDDINGNASYDVARANRGGNWRMPTKSEMEELVKKCFWKRIIRSGINGYKVIGPNGNSIFLPITGYCDGTSFNDVGDYGCYWSSTPNESINRYAYCLKFSKGYRDVDERSRYGGCTVRPVFDDVNRL